MASTILLSAFFLFSSPRATMRQRLEAATAPGADVVIAHHQVHTTVRPSGSSSVVETRLFKVLTPAGASQLTTLRFDVDPHTSTVEIERVLICHANGSCRSIQPHVATVPQPAGWILWRFLMKIVTIPAVEPGMGVEITTKKRGFSIAYLKTSPDDEFIPPMRGHFYDQVLFGDEIHPVMEKEYVLVMPASLRIHVREYNGPIASASSISRETTTYRWSMKNLPAFVSEPLMPAPSDSLPKVVLATVPDWHAKSRWFYEVNKDQFEVTPEIRAKTRELLKGVTDREKQIAILTRWVANHIRYRGFSMGKEEGYLLHSGKQVFEERAGVCKDIASMLVTMLRAAGFEAWPAMTMAGARVEPEPADQFNHSVVAVKNPDGTFSMLDPTWAPLDRYVWSFAEREQHYVIGLPQGRNLEMIPPSTPKENRVTFRLQTRMKDAKTLLVKGRLDGQGISDTTIRRAIGYAPAGETARLGNLIARKISPQATVSRFVHTDPWNFDRAMQLDVEMQVPNPWVEADNILWWSPLGVDGFPDFDRLLFWKPLRPNPNRRHPVLLRANQVVDLEETFEHTKPLTLRHLPAIRHVRNSEAELSWDVNVKGKKVTFTARLVLKNRRVEAARYTRLVEALTAFSGLSDMRVRLEVAK